MPKTLTRRVWLVIGWLLVLFVIWITLTPKPPHELQLIPHLDKIGHFLAYAVLTAWFAAILLGRKWLAGVTLGFIVMGGALEILQGFTGRDPSWFDWLIDAAGAVLGAGLPRAWLAQVYTWISGHEQRIRARPATR